MQTGNAEIICTGSELLSGKLNLYVPLFHTRLAPLGFAISREQSSGDNLASISSCIRGALGRADLVIVCGGLGPTFDDLTRQAAAKALNLSLAHSKTCALRLAGKYGLRTLPPNFKNQCLILAGAKIIENESGTAPGQVLTRGRRMLVLLPGPRAEWEPMFSGPLAPEIRSFFGFTPLLQVRLKIAGLWETQAEKLLLPVMRRFPKASYTILAGPGTVEFLLSGDDRGGQVTAAAAACRKALGGKVYGEGEDSLPSVVGTKLRETGRTLAAAESCTGGLAAQLLTGIPGSSAYFLGGAVTYSNKAKTKLLGVKASTLKKHGAVSGECAREMAAGAKRAFGSDYAFSVTGIAGPDGGSARKPVGLVYFGLEYPGGVKVLRGQFRGGRPAVRACAANFILDALRKILE